MFRGMETPPTGCSDLKCGSYLHPNQIGRGQDGENPFLEAWVTNTCRP